MKPEELKKRTKQFALRCLKVADALPRSPGARAIAGQLAASATSVAANYRSSCRARSHREFIAKIGVVEEEADESAFWLELTWEGEYLSKRRVAALHQEASELTAIFAASHITATKRARKVGSRAANQQSAISNQQ
jgi:four helix bundle protein